MSEAKQGSTGSLWNNFCIYNLSFLKKKNNPRRWLCRQCRAHSTWNALAASQWGLLATPHPAQSHAKSSCLQEKAKVTYERNGVGICWKHELDHCFLQQKIQSRKLWLWQNWDILSERMVWEVALLWAGDGIMCPPEIPSNLNYSLAFRILFFVGFPT